MIEDLLPAGVTSAEAFGDLADAVLFPEEEAAVSQAVAKRRREYTTARACARLAMGRLGLPPAPVLSGPRNEPRWPARIVGSITHCAGYRAAAVARDRVAAAVGIDAEPNAALPDGVLAEIALPQEQVCVQNLRRDDPTIAWDRLIFSAKESVYKAWYPLARRWLDFGEAVLTIDPFSGRFRARLLVPGPWVDGERLRIFHGRWLVREGLVLTAITVPSTASSGAETPAAVGPLAAAGPAMSRGFPPSAAVAL
jgi:4'-phosphopantetheinyl transferase EntD